MMFHRMGTISHILASTELHWCAKNEEFLSDEALIEKNAVEIVKQMQKLRGIDGDGQYGDSDSDSSNRLANRRTIHMLEKQRQKKKAIGTLDVAFKKRFFALNGQLAGQDGAPPEPGKIARKFIFTFCFVLFVWMPSQRKESGYPIRNFTSYPRT